ncbi:MAG: hypothetical protein L3J37_10045 [Rhodobacteraceae bacterium]|nr:hypothetical protein [Paracoccaceae bacterium]
MTLPTAQEIASLYLYGSSMPPEKFDSETLIRAKIVEVNGVPDSDATFVKVNVEEYEVPLEL